MPLRLPKLSAHPISAVTYPCQPSTGEGTCSEVHAFAGTTGSFGAAVHAFAGRAVRFTTRSRASFLPSGEQRVDSTKAGRSQVR